MPYANGKPTRTEQRQAWIMAGRQGPDPWPRAKSAADRAVRQEIDALNKQLKRGRYALRVLSDSETAALAERKRLRRAAVIQRGIQRAQRGPTQQAIAESWLARGRPADEPIPALIQQRADAKVRWNNKRLIEQALRKFERKVAGETQEQRGGRPDLPLDAVAGARLAVWFAVWDACVVPAEFDDRRERDNEPVTYGTVKRVDWARVPVVGAGRWPDATKD